MTLVAALAAGLSAAPAHADVVLNPGTVTGAAGITGWAQTYTNASISGNAAGYQGSASSNGTTYTVTTEGSQTYTNLSVSLSKSISGGSQSMSIQKSGLSLAVPGGGTLTYDMTFAGGYLQPVLNLTGGALV